MTAYAYLNLFALAGGIAAIVIALSMLRGEGRTRWTVAVVVIALLVGSFQVVRGVGLLPGITGCVSDSGISGVCTPTAEGYLADQGA